MNWPWKRKKLESPEDRIEVKVIDPTRVEIGHGFVAQQLINDKWILFNTKEPSRAFDLKNPEFRWAPGSTYYTRDCMADSLNDILKHAKDILAAQGICKDRIINDSLPFGRISAK